MIRLVDLQGPARELCLDQWLRGCCFAVIVGKLNGDLDYFASNPEWSSTDAEELADRLGGIAVDMMGEPEPFPIDEEDTTEEPMEDLTGYDI